MAKGKGKAALAAPETLTNETEFDQLQDADETEKVSKPKKSARVAASPNDELDLAQFNYDELTGDSFKEYVRLAGDHSAMEIVSGEEVPMRGSLQENQSFDFVLLKAKPVMQARFPGMKDTPFDYVGIRAEGKPLHTTRIPVKTALEFNRQILNAHSRAGHGKYYFLKK
jgi:hypothetical protein